MTYEVKLALTDLAPSRPVDHTYALYLNEVLGADRWLMTKVPGDPRDPWPNAATLVCPHDAVIKLKWMDIVDGRQRVMSTRPLPVDDAQALRARQGGRLPWE